MHVVATAGHVDHGKSTLVEALTGANPDRLAEERRRGLTIELGYCWTSWPEVGEVAFVDVPGHERFLTTMLSGVGPVPAALFVVAADDPWMPQAAEHLAALDALGVRHAVVAVTRADLADPGPAAARAAAEVARTSLAGAPVIAVSAHTGTGLDDLRAALGPDHQGLPPALRRRLAVHEAGHAVVVAALDLGRVRRHGDDGLDRNVGAGSLGDLTGPRDVRHGIRHGFSLGLRLGGEGRPRGARAREGEHGQRPPAQTRLTGGGLDGPLALPGAVRSNDDDIDLLLHGHSPHHPSVHGRPVRPHPRCPSPGWPAPSRTSPP